MESLLTVLDVVRVTRLSKSKVYGLIEKGILPSVRLPGCDRVLIAPEDLRRYLEAGKCAAADAMASQLGEKA